MKSLRNRVRISLEEKQNDRQSTWIVKVIGIATVSLIVLVILATEPVISGPSLNLLAKLDLIVTILFLSEYLSCLWIAPLRDGARKGVLGVLEFAITPMVILSLVVIAPTILGFITPELYLLRIIRLVRIGRTGRSNRFQKSVMHFNHAITSKREELQILAIYSAVVISISSALMYLVERGRLRSLAQFLDVCVVNHCHNHRWLWRCLSRNCGRKDSGCYDGIVRDCCDRDPCRNSFFWHYRFFEVRKNKFRL